MSGMMVVILALVIVAGIKTKAENTGSHIADDTENSYEQQVAGQTDTTQDSGQEKWQKRSTHDGTVYSRRVWSLMREKSICIIQISKPTS